MSNQVGYRRTIYCHEIFNVEPCCSDCKELHPHRVIYLGPPHEDGVNYDYLIPLDLYTCCNHFHAAKLLPRSWWIGKMLQLGLKMVIMNPKGGIDYKAMGLLDKEYNPSKNDYTYPSKPKISKVVMCKSCKEEEAEKQGYCSNCARLRNIK